jgi:hypothetical protein
MQQTRIFMNTKCQLFFMLIMVCLLNVQTVWAQQNIIAKYKTIKPVRHAQNPVLEQWQDYFFSPDDCQCVHGDEYFISLKEVDPESDNLMISLQGGGACWPGLERCKTDVTEQDVATANFTLQLADKLKEDWNQVVIPYCDGSIYMGDTQGDYDENEHTDHWHDGLKISVAALNFIHHKYPDAKKIFLTGCSAGGYGTIVQARLLRQLYPSADLYVLNESGPGLLKPDPDFWKMIDATWNLSQLMPEDCAPCEGQLIYWYDDLLQDPKIKIGLYSAYQDEVIGQAFLQMTPADYKELLLTSSQKLHDDHPDQFKRFFINGNTHCVQDRDYQINGVTYWDWVLAFLNDGELWRDLLE